MTLRCCCSSSSSRTSTSPSTGADHEPSGRRTKSSHSHVFWRTTPLDWFTDRIFHRLTAGRRDLRPIWKSDRRSTKDRVSTADIDGFMDCPRPWTPFEVITVVVLTWTGVGVWAVSRSWPGSERCRWARTEPVIRARAVKGSAGRNKRTDEGLSVGSEPARIRWELIGRRQRWRQRMNCWVAGHRQRRRSAWISTGRGTGVVRARTRAAIRVVDWGWPAGVVSGRVHCSRSSRWRCATHGGTVVLRGTLS